jgi:methionine-rich copper-binding protein CopC
MKNIKQKLLIAGVVIIIIIVAVFIYLSPKKVIIPTTTPTVTSSVPNDGSSGVNVFDPITITFNQNVDPTSITVTSDPAENWTISQDSPKSITVNHSLYLRIATTYKLTVMQHGNVIETLTFETAHDQNDPRQLQSLKSQLNQDYPLASLTPYETSDFRVVYSAPLTLEIDIKSSIGTQDAILQVQSWVKSQGVDPATHKYITVTATPAP